jgi:integrase
MLEKRKGLSAAKVNAAKLPGKYYDAHGLFLRVEASGSKRWVQRITIHSRQREIGLGSADLVSLAEARDMAIENRKLARAGGDPLAAKRIKVALPTFNEAVQKVIELHAPTWTNEKHAAQFRSTLATYAGPIIGAKPVSDVTTADVLRILTPIWTSKAETARRVKQRIGTVMQWAIAQGYRSDNPSAALTQALPKQGQKVQHRKSLPYDEVAVCISTIQASDAMLSTKLALEFLILTAARSGEVRGATWDEIDFDRKVWSIPAERMKAKVEHVVPLSDRACELLDEAKQLGTSDLVFPGMKEGKPMSDMTMSKLVKELGFATDVHGFRTSFRVWVQEKTNTPFEVAEKALAHKTSNKVVAAYARSDLFEKRRALMEAWARFLNNGSAKVLRLGASA